MNLLIKLHESQSNRQFGRDIYPPESRLMGEVLKFAAAIPTVGTITHPDNCSSNAVWGSRERPLSTRALPGNTKISSRQTNKGLTGSASACESTHRLRGLSLEWEWSKSETLRRTQPSTTAWHPCQWLDFSEIQAKGRGLIPRLRLLARLQNTSICSSIFPLISHKKKKITTEKTMVPRAHNFV